MSTDTKNQLAVALHYDRTGAPRVVAKGKGAIGAKIIEVAKAHDIPIEENEVLAGALSNVELGDEIPAELYKAVAEVLMFVLRLNKRGALVCFLSMPAQRERHRPDVAAALRADRDVCRLPRVVIDRLGREIRAACRHLDVVAGGAA